MKVLQVCFSSGWGGLEMLPLNLAQSANDLGVQMVLAVSPKTPLALSAEKRSFSPFLFNMNRYVDLIGIWKLARFIDQQKIDLIHAHLARDLWKVVPAARRSHRRPRVIWTNHMSSRRSKKDPINRWVYSHLDLAMPVSNDASQKMLKALPLTEKQVKRVYLGIDLKRFNPERIKRVTSRRALGFFGDEFVVGIVGQVEPGKGQKEFLEAAQFLSNKFPRSRYIISGRFQPGHEDYARVLKQMVATRELSKRAFLLGHRSEPENIYRALDVLVMASYGETFGLVLVEAMAMGVPVIATHAKGVPEIIQHEKTGLLIPPKDSKALSSAIVRLMQYPGLRRRLAEEGQRFCKENFGWTRYVSDLKNIYHDVAGYPPLPTSLVESTAN